MQTKKGFILIYTIIVGIICLIIMMYIFGIQVTEVKYSTSTKKYLLKEDNYQKYKEYLMTLFFTYIDENNEQIKKAGINEFFINFNSKIIKYEKAKVSYSNSTNEFIFATPYDDRANRNDYFKLEASGESFKLIFIKTDYTY